MNKIIIELEELLKNTCDKCDKRIRNPIMDAIIAIDNLTHWIKEQGIRNDICTYDILKEKCEGCNCKRKRN